MPAKALIAPGVIPEGAVIRQRVRKRIGPVTELTEQQARARKNEILVSEGATAISTGARPVSHTVAEFVALRFMPEHVALLKKAGRLHYGTYLKNHVLPGIGPLRLKDVSHDDIQHLIRQTECETAADSLKGGGA
jgi:hypothetical protein